METLNARRIKRLAIGLAKATNAREMANSIAIEIPGCWERDSFSSIAYSVGTLSAIVSAMQTEAGHDEDFALSELGSADRLIDDFPLRRVSKYSPDDVIHSWSRIANSLSIVAHLYELELDLTARGLIGKEVGV